MPKELKQNSYYLADRGWPVSTNVGNPRAAQYSADIEIANKSRDNFYALRELETSVEEDTRNAVLSGAKGFAHFGVDTVQTLGRNLYTWSMFQARALRAANEATVQTGLKLALGQEQDYQNIVDKYNASSEYARKELKYLEKSHERFLDMVNLTPDEKDGLSFTFGNALGSVGASIVGGVYLKAPKAVGLVFGVLNGQKEYEEALDNGVAPVKAAALGTVGGAVEAALEYIPLERLGRVFRGSTGVRKIVSAAALEAMQEGSQTTAEEILMQGFGGREKDIYDTLADIALSAAMGALIGGGMASVDVVYNEGVKGLVKLGVDEDTAKQMAKMQIDAGLSPEMSKEAVDLLHDQEHPVTWPDNDITKGAQEFEQAYKNAEFGKQLDAVQTAARERLETTGIKKEEAVIGAALERKIVEMIAVSNKLSPTAAAEYLEIQITNAGDAVSNTRAEAKFINEFNTLAEDERAVFLNEVKQKNLQTPQELLAEITAFKEDISFDFNQAALSNKGFEIKLPAGSAAVAQLNGLELNAEANIKPLRLLKKDAENYYNQHIRNKTVIRPDIGEILFDATGRRETLGKQYNRGKMLLVPSLLDITEKGFYAGSKDVQRNDGIKKFHYIQAVVNVNGIDTIAQVDIAERFDGKKFYTLMENKNALGEDTAHQNTVFPKANNSIAENEDIVKGQEGKTFKQGKRAAVKITSKDGFVKAVINAMQSADESSFVHEMSHIYLTVFQSVYDNATYQETRKDLDKWLGKARGGVYSERQQEKFAKGFEQYLMEGKAPAPYLQQAFDQFRSWLINIYNGEPQASLSDAAKNVYAKMLTVEGTAAKESVEFFQSAKKDYGKIREVVEKIKNDDIKLADLKDVELDKIKDFISILNKPTPSLPKRTLITDLRSSGADYKNAAAVDKEAYKNARVYDRATGIGDKPALWLAEHGYMAEYNPKTYEEMQSLDAQANELINRALNGEAVYRLEDMERVRVREEFLEAVNMAEDVIGNNYKNYEKILNNIDALKKKGYRVVEKSDLDFINSKFEEIANLRESERLIDQEEGVYRVDDSRRGSADERRADKVKKARLENLRKAQALKTAVIEELGTRQIEGKENIVDLMNRAQTVDEIYSAADGVFSIIESAYGNSEEGRLSQSKLNPPKLDWDNRRLNLLKDIAEINQRTDANTAWAFKAIEREGLITPFKTGISEQEINRPAAVDEKQRKLNIWRAEQILDEQLRNRYYKAFEGALSKVPNLTAGQKTVLLKSFNNISYRNKNVTKMITDTFDNAKTYIENNYKKYIWEKVEEIIKAPVFEKHGSLRTAKYTLQAQDFLKRAHNLATLSNEQAQETFMRHVENIDYEQTLTKEQILLNKILQLKAAPEGVSPAAAKQLYDEMNEFKKASRSEVRTVKFLRDTGEDVLRERLLEALNKQKIVKGSLLYIDKLANWQSIINTLFGTHEFTEYSHTNEQAGRKINVKFMDVLSLEQNHIQMQNHINKMRRTLVRDFGAAYGFKDGNNYIKKINELLNQNYTFDNYGHIPQGHPAELLTERQKQPVKQTINKLELLFFWIQSNNTWNDLRLRRAYREQYDTMFDALSAQDKAAGRALMKIAQSTYELMNEVHIRERGLSLGKVENYFPNRVERITGGLDYLREIISNNVNPAAVKQRAKTHMAVEKPVNPVSLLFGEISRNAEYIYGAEDINKLRRVFRTPEMQHALEAKLGQKEGRKIYQKLLKMIDLNSPSSRIEAKSNFFETFNFLFNNWIKSSIGLKPIVAIKQFASAFNYAEDMPMDVWIKGFSDALLSPKETLTFMQELSPYINTRYEQGGMNETLGRALAQNETVGVPAKINDLTNAITFNVRLGDKFALVFGGKPYVDYLIKEKGYTKDQAREAFEKATVRSQQADLRSTLNEAQMESGNLFWRAAWAFRNQQMQYARKLADAYFDYRNGAISEKDLTKKVFIYGVLNPLVYTMLSLGWFADDEDDRKDDYMRLLASPFEQTAGAMPFGDDLVELVFNNLRSLIKDGEFTGMRSYELPGIADMYKTLNKVVKNFNSSETTLEDWLNTLAEVGQFSGFGTKAVKGQLGGAYDIVTGKPIKGAMQVIGYTENRAKKVTGNDD